MKSVAEDELRARFAAALELDADVTVEGPATLPGRYPVSELAAAAVATAGAAVATLLDALGFGSPPVGVRREYADAWFATAVRPSGWTAPPPWDPIAGDYRAADGWVRLHTNAAHHRAAALRVLGVTGGRSAVTAEVARRPALELQEAVVAAGGCAAQLLTPEQWAEHPQGRAVAGLPLVERAGTAAGPSTPGWRPTRERPLAGLRVLDLTRVLAGPAATRLLAGLGADVLRIDPPQWAEPALEPEMTLGKRPARLDARGDGTLAELLAGADVLVHGYRGGALDGLGLSAAERERIRPGLVDVSLTAYGQAGPWARRRGFDSLVQMSSGIAYAGPEERPAPLPVQGLDHATGYLMA
ncbi:MAG TPA: CoA transferase, partial [Jatrophihabitans sp.]|nr:CoA transferase [Jatrophihabitans sp.]